MGGDGGIETFFVVGDSVFRRMETKMRLKLILAVLALAALVMPGTADKVDDLLLDLKFGDYGVQIAAIGALGEIGDTRAVGPLIEMIPKPSGYVSYEDDSWKRSIRIAAVQALSKIGDPSAVDPLISIVSTSDDHWIKMEAALALGKIGDPRAVDALNRMS